MSTDPGIYDDLDEAAYHSHPALSQSQAKTLLECPAKYRWQLDNPPPPRDVFDLGHAAHSKILGAGDPVVGLSYDDWRSKAARDARDEARANGFTPLLAKDAARVDRMAEAVLAHAGARSILESDGAVEQSMFWTQDDVPMRGRVDKVATTTDGLHVLADLKTTVDANPATFGKSVANYGYHLQAATYPEAWQILTGEPTSMLFIAVEKEPPHLVSLIVLDEYAVQVGSERMADARRIWRECTDTGHWPAYPSELTTVYLPRWAS